ncbi:MAG: hypothetical protein GC154_17330 [bacterium]|nr:hypothetical protein [bacterium]
MTALAIIQLVSEIIADAFDPIAIGLIASGALLWRASIELTDHAPPRYAWRGRLFLYLGGGWLSFRLVAWIALAIMASVNDPPGSFLWPSAIYAHDKAAALRLNHLSELIQRRWLTPAPNGLAFSKPVPADARERLIAGVLESASFWRELQENGGLESYAAQLASLAVEVVHSVNPVLKAPATLKPFLFDKEEYERRIHEGVDLNAALDAFNSFTGRWYGMWKEIPVDHEWTRAVEYDPPWEITQNENTLFIHGLQYAWIGDGFGWNIVVSFDNPDNPTHILGTVYHVKDHNPAFVYLHRAHIGLVMDGGLVWITRKEVFFEEATVYNQMPVYTISGFQYLRSADRIEDVTQIFQTYYTSNRQARGAWSIMQIPQ